MFKQGDRVVYVGTPGPMFTALGIKKDEEYTVRGYDSSNNNGLLFYEIFMRHFYNDNTERGFNDRCFRKVDTFASDICTAIETQMHEFDELIETRVEELGKLKTK